MTPKTKNIAKSKDNDVLMNLARTVGTTLGVAAATLSKGSEILHTRTGGAKRTAKIAARKARSKKTPAARSGRSTSARSVTRKSKAKSRR